MRLINVLEELCKTKLPAYDPKPRVQIQKVQNLNIALSYIKQQGIKLIGVDPQVIFFSFHILYKILCGAEI